MFFIVSSLHVRWEIHGTYYIMIHRYIERMSGLHMVVFLEKYNFDLTKYPSYYVSLGQSHILMKQVYHSPLTSPILQRSIMTIALKKKKD